uniref:histidine--tRNA ligase n=1 Tax=Globodera rostochiensis TaxID=31243 RepID=A0A914HDL2_GLORO
MPLNETADAENDDINKNCKVKARKEALLKKKMELGDEFKSKYELKTPKGTRDFGPEQMAIREKVLGIVTETFKRHGAATIETPVFELREVLMGKYGEEGSKLVYDLADQGGELCSLRYDLTVPFARYLAANKIEKIKRYQIAKVYRRDQPVMTKGRYREFYQCDFDIAGQGELMMQEAECLKIVEEVLTKLDVGEFEIRINHRLLLDGMFAASGVAEHLFKTVSSSVDKLDKQPWAEVREELERDKHVEEGTVHRLGELVCLREKHSDWDNQTLLEWLTKKRWSEEGNFPSVSDKSLQNIRQGVDELKLLFQYTELFGCDQSRIVFQPSLARGLDYYTGVIFEVVLKEFSFNSNVASTNKRSPQKKKNLATEENSETESSGSAILGSVAAGGRYDKLVGMFTDMGRGEKDGGKEGSAKKRPDVPCVGVSFGIERLFTVMEMKAHADAEHTVRVSPTQVYVTSASASKDISAIMLQERMRLCGQLWNAGIRAETNYKTNAKLLQQIQFCENKNNQIQWLLILGAKELAENSVKLRCIPTREEELVKMEEIFQEMVNERNSMR